MSFIEGRLKLNKLLLKIFNNLKIHSFFFIKIYLLTPLKNLRFLSVTSLEYFRLNVLEERFEDDTVDISKSNANIFKYQGNF